VRRLCRSSRGCGSCMVRGGAASFPLACALPACISLSLPSQDLYLPGCPPACLQGPRSFFSEIISSINDIKFSPCGRYILSRDYMALKLWDINMDSGPLASYPVHESLRGRVRGRGAEQGCGVPVEGGSRGAGQAVPAKLQGQLLRLCGQSGACKAGGAEVDTLVSCTRCHTTCLACTHRHRPPAYPCHPPPAAV